MNIINKTIKGNPTKAEANKLLKEWQNNLKLNDWKIELVLNRDNKKYVLGHLTE